MSVTVIDVAEEAGVSRTTVSNVFSGKGNYSDDTARQLEIQFKQLQQVVMSLARKLEPDSTPDPGKPKIDVTADRILSKLNIKILQS